MRVTGLVHVLESEAPRDVRVRATMIHMLELQSFSDTHSVSHAYHPQLFP